MSATGPQVREAVEDVLARDVRPALSAHAGTIELVAVDHGRIDLRFRRSCAACYFRRGCAAHLVEPAVRAIVDSNYELQIR